MQNYFTRKKKETKPKEDTTAVTELLDQCDRIQPPAACRLDSIKNQAVVDKCKPVDLNKLTPIDGPAATHVRGKTVQDLCENDMGIPLILFTDGTTSHWVSLDRTGKNKANSL